MQIRKRKSASSIAVFLLRNITFVTIVIALTVLSVCYLNLDVTATSFSSSGSLTQKLSSSLGSSLQQQQVVVTEEQDYPPYYPPYSTKTNAIIYMAQKSHKVYLRDSLALLERSLELLFTNYLMIDAHYTNATVFIFHTGDFDAADLEAWEQKFPAETKGTIQLVNLLNTPYWQVPSWLDAADLPKWRNPEFNIGYRHM